jgi:26S proteasome regulatory subunit N2
MQGVLGDYIRRTDKADMLSHCVNIAMLHVFDIEFRRDVLRTLANMYRSDLKSIDYFALVHCLVFLNEHKQVAELVVRLLASGTEVDILTAMQIALEVFDFCSQEFVSGVVRDLTAQLQAASEGNDRLKDGYRKVLSILSGTVTTELYLKYLYSQNKADIHILNKVKKGIEGKNTITHNALVIANSIMYSGTTIDGFLRDNLEWLGRASNWSKFTATASVGVIHKGHVKEGMHILEPYLPKGPSTSPYQEAGALYGLGLISAPLGISARGAAQGTDTDIVEYLLNSLRQYHATEQIVHGAALGLGLTAMGLHSEEMYDVLFGTMGSSDAVAGEACAVSIGLVMLGSANTTVATTLLSHARETDQKEKIIRGISMGLALLMYGHEGDANTWAEQLLSDKDHWLRMGGCQILAMAYAGTGNTKAIERLLQIGVKDVSDDVRRMAIMSIGFLTFKDPQMCVDIIKILNDSYNTHIRYGVAMALGIAAAGTGHKATVELLWTMKADTCDFVRQGALIALSMVLMQKTEKEQPRTAEFRTLLMTKIEDKHEDVCTKFGCIIATGILDAGGRNTVIALHNRRHNLTKSIVSLFLFSQYWYWFPYTLMISQSLQPTCFIGLNADLAMPKCPVRSDAPASLYAPPRSVKEEKKEEKREMARVELSTTKKEMARQQKRREQSTTWDSEAMPRASSTKDLSAQDTTKKEERKEEKKEDKPKPEPTFEMLNNPARVTRSQFDVLTLEAGSRYRSLKNPPAGICMLLDTRGGEAVELVEDIKPLTGDDGEEPAPPAPFTWP